MTCTRKKDKAELAPLNQPEQVLLPPDGAGQAAAAGEPLCIYAAKLLIERGRARIRLCAGMWEGQKLVGRLLPPTRSQGYGCCCYPVADDDSGLHHQPTYSSAKLLLQGAQRLLQAAFSHWSPEKAVTKEYAVPQLLSVV